MLHSKHEELRTEFGPSAQRESRTRQLGSATLAGFECLYWDWHVVAFIHGLLTESSFETHQDFIIGFILQVGQPRGRMAS